MKDRRARGHRAGQSGPKGLRAASERRTFDKEPRQLHYAFRMA